MTDSLIHIKGLTKSYPSKGAGEVLAVQNVDLELNKGDFVALKGPSGCGKTTLLLAAGALLSPNSGEVLINGQNPYKLSQPERSAFRAQNLGFVFQSFHLIPYLTVLENVMLCELAGSGKDIKTCVTELLEKFGLTKRLKHLPSELSVGEQQRVALARAVCSGASIILADEPTGNLDTENGKRVLEYLADFAKNGGAVLMVTHDHNAGDYAFRHVDMVDGKIV
jgi:putative ABC transport system ATP-binding protein